MNSRDPNRSPQTVHQAVSQARELHAGPGGPLVFGDDVATGVGSLARKAGPPHKILGHLTTLAQLARALRTGSLGMTQVQWLETHNLTVSHESESTRNSTKEMQRRTWHDGHGRRTFELHTKPSVGSRPHRCVRIYFAWDSERSAIVIGWVGRHP